MMVKTNSLNRLVKDNVAQILVLKPMFSNQGIDSPGKRQLVCVVHTLLKGLEKIATIADIPVLMCGDFNSVSRSAPHALFAMGNDPLHPDLAVDHLGIICPTAKLTHQLPLVSAYSSFERAGVGLALEQRRKMDPATNEPLFTNCTSDFTGTNDYIFYSADSLTVESLLELVYEKIMHFHLLNGRQIT